MVGAERFYITTTIPYVNGDPHIGHAEEFAQTDAFGRYHRLRGDDTYVLTGTDENSLKNVLAAEREEIAVEQLVERNSEKFRTLADSLHFSYDQFIRTAVEPKHRAASEKLWAAVQARGDIYQKSYSGLYCVGCELFYDEDELIGGNCPDGHGELTLVSEENYFFRLSRYADQLEELIASDTLAIVPEFRKNEALSFIRHGLQDFSVSRSMERARGWGIPVPGDPSQVMYVWFDALINYISALDYAGDGPLYHRYWIDNPQRVHALGKGVIRFHAIYWPAMLLSAGIPVPTTEFVHGYINIAGGKMSKSVGNVIDPRALVDQYGAEAVRYFLLRGIHPVRDADFADIDAFHQLLRERYNADLANDLGNLVNRAISMIGRYRGGTVPAPGPETDIETEVQSLAATLPATIDTAMARYDPQSALIGIWDLVKRTNRYAEQSEPWSVAKAEKGGTPGAAEQLNTALFTLAEAVRISGAALAPFLPETSEKIAAQLGASQDSPWQQQLAWGDALIGATVSTPSPLFPRLEDPIAISG